MNPTDTLPASLYRTATIRKIEEAASTAPLMQRAGAAVFAWATMLATERAWPILVLAGPGNNGGDAIEAARLLRRSGHDVVTVFIGRSDRLPSDAAAAHRRFSDEGGISLPAIPSGGNWSLLIDGLFGIGLARKPDNEVYALIEQANRLAAENECPLLAIDCPSGLDADSGRIQGTAIRATQTLTFLGLKPGLFTLEGPDHCGEIRLDSLGTETLAPAPAADGRLVTLDDFAAHLQQRRLNTHKGSFGRAFVIGGAQGMVGAAILAARAALKLGAGRVYAGLLAPDASRPVIDFIQPELMLYFADELLAAQESPDATLCGPGLGRSNTALRLLERILQVDRPLLLDADALNLLADDDALASLLKKRQHDTLLTPHPAEAARLLSWPLERIQDDRIAAAGEIARRFRASVALKGCGTIITNPEGSWRINRSGNPALASAGSGDVLGGIAVALLAQGWPGFEALLAAVHMHGLAAEDWARRFCGTTGMTAGEIVEPARFYFNGWLTKKGNR